MFGRVFRDLINNQNLYLTFLWLQPEAQFLWQRLKKTRLLVDYASPIYNRFTRSGIR